jgi:hypothetical protein
VNALRALPGILLMAFCTGCSLTGGSEPTAEVVVVEPESVDVVTPIVGASREQRQVVREILAGVGSESIRRVEIRPAGPDYRPHPRGAVGVIVKHRKGFTPTWESGLIAQAFVNRSLREGLPAVAYIATEGTSSRASPSLSAADDALSSEQRGALVDRLVEHGEKAKAEVRSVRVMRPFGRAIAISFRAADTARFLATRWERLEADVFRLVRNRFSAGVLMSVEDASGANVLGVANVGQYAGSGWIAPKYEGCASVSLSPPVGYTPPPCPLGA